MGTLFVPEGKFVGTATQSHKYIPNKTLGLGGGAVAHPVLTALDNKRLLVTRVRFPSVVLHVIASLLQTTFLSLFNLFFTKAQQWPKVYIKISK